MYTSLFSVKVVLQQTKDLLSFKAFKPSKLDVKGPLTERFQKAGAIMGVSVSTHFLTCAEIQFTNEGKVAISKTKRIAINAEGQETPNIESLVAAEEEKLKAITLFARENSLSHVLLLNSPEIQIIKVDTSSQKIGIDRLYDTKYNLSEILSEQPEEGRAYVYVSNQKCEETLVFSYDQVKVDESANLLATAGLQVVRVGCSIYAIIDYLLNDQPEFLSQDQILLIYSSDCLFIASISESSFEQIGFRANIEAEDMPSYVSRMIERFECNHSQVSYVSCSDWDIKTYFTQNYPSLKIVPVFEDSFKGIFEAASYG